MTNYRTLVRRFIMLGAALGFVNNGIADYETAEVDLPAKVRSININFTKAGYPLDESDGTTLVGAPDYAIACSNWNSLAIVDSRTTEQTAKISVYNDDADVDLSIIGSRGYWTCPQLSSSTNLLYAYIDDVVSSVNGSSPTVTVSRIPFTKCRVIVYASTDMATTAFSSYTINGVDVSANAKGVAVQSTRAWGNSGSYESASPLEQGVNYLVTPVIDLGDDGTLHIVTHNQANSNGTYNRGTIAAIQIVETDEEISPAEDRGKYYDSCDDHNRLLDPIFAVDGAFGDFGEGWNEIIPGCRIDLHGGIVAEDGKSVAIADGGMLLDFSRQFTNITVVVECEGLPPAKITRGLFAIATTNPTYTNRVGVTINESGEISGFYNFNADSTDCSEFTDGTSNGAVPQNGTKTYLVFHYDRNTDESNNGVSLYVLYPGIGKRFYRGESLKWATDNITGIAIGGVYGNAYAPCSGLVVRSLAVFEGDVVDGRVDLGEDGSVWLPSYAESVVAEGEIYDGITDLSQFNWPFIFEHTSNAKAGTNNVVALHVDGISTLDITRPVYVDKLILAGSGEVTLRTSGNGSIYPKVINTSAYSGTLRFVVGDGARLDYYLGGSENSVYTGDYLPFRYYDTIVEESGAVGFTYAPDMPCRAVSSFNFSRLTGTGTISLDTVYEGNSNWILFPTQKFADTLSFNNESDIVMMPAFSDSNPFVVHNLSGNGRFRCDWSTYVMRMLKTVQTRNTTFTGRFMSNTNGNNARECNLNILSDGDVPDYDNKRLVLSGEGGLETASESVNWSFRDAKGTLTVEPTGALEINYMWGGPAVIQGAVGGSGGFASNVVFQTGAEFIVSTNGHLTATGSLAFGDSLTVRTEKEPSGLLVLAVEDSVSVPDISGTDLILYVNGERSDLFRFLVMEDGLYVAPKDGVKSVRFDVGEHGHRAGGGNLLQFITGETAIEAPVMRGDNGWAFVGWDVDIENMEDGDVATAQYRTLKADLHVDSLLVPASAMTGDSITINWTVGNTGNSNWSRNTREQIRLVDENDPSNMIVVADLNEELEIERAGGQVERSYEWTIPVKGLSGAWRVVVETGMGSIYEHGGDNTLTAETVLVLGQCPLPDLSIKSIELDAFEYMPLDTVTVRYVVQNTGTGAATAPWRDRLYLCKNGAKVTLATVDISDDIAAGAEVERTIQCVIPELVALSGDVAFVVKVDCDDSIVELADDDSNENATWEATPNATLDKRIYLTFASLSVNENNSSGVRFYAKRSGEVEESLELSLTAFGATSDVTFPDSLTINAGASSVTGYVRPLDNSAVDGTRLVTFMLSPVNDETYTPVSQVFSIIDNEVPKLTMIFDKVSVKEGDAAIIVTVTRELVTDEPLTVYLNGVSASHCSYPSSVVIPAGEASVTFELAAVDNDAAEIAAALTLRASANGYTAATQSFSVEDDDVPSVTLTIYPEELSEGAGPNAAYAILSRVNEDNIGSAITVNLTPSIPNQLILQSSVTIPAYTMAVRFQFGPVDNGDDEGDRDITITGSIYIPSCGCSSQPSSGDVIEATIRIIDNDVPALSLTADPSTMKEGLDHAGDLILTHNSVLAEDLVVSLSFDTEGEIEIPASVVIPAGETSVTIPVKTIDDGETDGGKLVSVYADDETGVFATASTWIQVSDQNLSDLKVVGISLPESVYAGKKFDVDFETSNIGFVNAPSEIEYNVHLIGGARGSSASSANMVYSGKIANSIVIGESIVTSLTVDSPSDTGDYRIVVVLDPDGKISELDDANNSFTSDAIAVSAAYTATVAVADKVYLRGDEIVFTGNAVMPNGTTPASDLPVDLYVLVNGMRRTYHLVTDANGAFGMTFEPSSGEAGRYTIGACYPGVASTVAQDYFDILGMKRSSTSNIIWDYALGDVATRTVYIQNRSGTPLTGLTATFTGIPEECDLQYTLPDTIPANGSVALAMTATAVGVTEQVDYSKFTAHLEVAEGLTLDFPLYFHSQTQKAYLRANPSSINTTMAIGHTRYIDVTISNDGKGDSGLISLSVPDVKWLRIISGTTIDNLASGESATVTLEVAPEESHQLTLNNPLQGGFVIANCENGVGCRMPLSFTPVTEATGGLFISVYDNNSIYLESHPMVSNANIVVSNPYTGKVICRGGTDNDGAFVAELIPEGTYNINISADGHESVLLMASIESARQTFVNAFMQCNLVSFSWDVAKTEIEDEYTVSLICDYETQVVAPIVKVDGLDELPSLAEGESFTFAFTYSNEGKIAASNVLITPPEIEGYEFLLSENNFSIPAGGSIIVSIQFVRNISSQLLLNNVNQTLRDSVQDDIYRVATIYDFRNTIKYICGEELPKYDVHKAVKFGETEKRTIRSNQLPDLSKLFSEGEYDGDNTPTRSVGSNQNDTGRFISGGGISYPTKADCNIPLWAKAAWNLNPYTAPYRAAIGTFKFLDKYDNAETAWEKAKVVGGAIWNKALDAGKSWAAKKAVKEFTTIVGAAGRGVNYLGDVIETGIGKVSDVTDTLNQIVDGAVDRVIGETFFYINPLRSSRQSILLSAEDETMEDLDSATEKTVIEICASQLKIDVNLLLGALLMDRFYEYQDCIMEKMFGVPIDKEQDAVMALLDLLQRNADNDAAPEFDDIEQLKQFGWTELEISHINDLITNGASEVSAVREMLCRMDALNILANEYCGYETAGYLFAEAIPSATAKYADVDDNSVCASISLRLSQTFAMTREAFDGTLTLHNGNSTTPIDSIKLDVSVLDEEGDECKDLFEIFANGTSGDMSEGSVLSGGLSVSAGGTGSAMVRFIPERGAAPTEEKLYRFGGTVTYTDPFSGETATVKLTPVSLTVSPSPYLHLDYFVQRDVFADDPFTADIVEASMPAEMAVLVHNVGAGNANNVTIASAKPEIVKNEKGLAVDFDWKDYSLDACALNGATAHLSLNTVSLGTIEPDAVKVAQWWLTSSIEGHFIGMSATVTPVNSWNTPDTALVDPDVGVHKLVRSIVADGDSLPDFLVCDGSDLYGTPNEIYTARGDQLSVNMANVSGEADLSGSEIAMQITVSPTHSGWNYGYLAKAGLFRYTITRVVRSDDAEISVRNAWITDRTFRDGATPLLEERLHIVDEFESGDAQTYTVYLSAKPTDVVEVSEFNISNGSIEYVARNSIEVQFSKAIDASTFTLDDVVLRKQGVLVDDISSLSITPSDATGTRFTISGLAALCGDLGRYELVVQCAGIYDLSGQIGISGKSVAWTLSTPDSPYILDAEGRPTKRVRRMDGVTTVTSIPVTEESAQNLVVTLNGTDVSQFVTIHASDNTGTRFSIEGLDDLQLNDGDYTLVIDCGNLVGIDGGSGIDSYTVTWTRDTTAPVVNGVSREMGLNGTSFILDLTEDADPETISLDNVMLTRKTSQKLNLARGLLGVAPAGETEIALPATARLTALGDGSYSVSGLDSVILADGTYTLYFDATGVADEAGNEASGVKSVSWTVDTTPPDEVTDITVSSEYGSVDTCVYTATRELTISGTVPESGLTVEVFAKYVGSAETLLAEPEVDGNLRFTADVTLPGDGNLTIIIRLTDEYGNSSDTEFAVYVDAIALGAEISGMPEPDVAADTLTITFLNGTPAEASALAATMSLTKDGVAVAIPNVTIARTEDRIYTVSGLANYTAEYGTYVFSYDVREVAKVTSGMTGDAVATATWVNYPTDTTAPTIAAIKFNGAAPEAAYVTDQMFSEVSVRFSEAVNVPDLVSRGVAGQAFSIQLLSDNNAVVGTLPAEDIAWNASTFTASWTIDGSAVPCGRARLVVDPSLIKDTSGNGLATTEAYDVISGAKAYTPSLLKSGVAHSYACPALYDWNNDGLLDLVVGEKTEDAKGKVRIYLNRGTATEPEFDDYTYLKKDDADVEFEAQGCVGMQVSFGRSHGATMFLASSQGEIYGWRHRYRKLKTNEALDFMLWFDHDTDSRFSSLIRTQTFCCDMDGDGYDEVVVSGQNSPMFWMKRVYTGDEARTECTPLMDASGAMLQYPEGQNHTAAVLTDVSGDAVMDLVTGDSAGNVWVYYGQGNGRFSATPIQIYANPDVGNKRSRLAVGDLNGDGVEDILIGRQDGSILLLSGEALLTPAINFRCVEIKSVEQALSEDLYWVDAAEGWVCEQSGDDAQASVVHEDPGEVTLLSARFVGAGTVSFSWGVTGNAVDSTISCTGGDVELSKTGPFAMVAQQVVFTDEGAHEITWIFSGKNKAVIRDVQFAPYSPEAQCTSSSLVPIKYADIRSFAADIWKAKGGDYEAAVVETAANGKSVMENCIVGLDSSDPDAKFIATINVEDGIPKVCWEPALNGVENGEGIQTGIRIYTVYGKTSLSSEEDWTIVTPENKALMQFFQVEVKLP